MILIRIAPGPGRFAAGEALPPEARERKRRPCSALPVFRGGDYRHGSPSPAPFVRIRRP